MRICFFVVKMMAGYFVTVSNQNFKMVAKMTAVGTNRQNGIVTLTHCFYIKSMKILLMSNSL